MLPSHGFEAAARSPSGTTRGVKKNQTLKAPGPGEGIPVFRGWIKSTRGRIGGAAAGRRWERRPWRLLAPYPCRSRSDPCSAASPGKFGAAKEPKPKLEKERLLVLSRDSNGKLLVRDLAALTGRTKKPKQAGGLCQKEGKSEGIGF